MRGHLEPRGKDVWRAKVYLGRDADKSKRYLTRTIHGSKRRAEDVLAQMIVEAGGGGHDVTDGTVANLASRWLTITRPSLSPTTLWGYERLPEKVIVPRLGPVKLRALRPQAIDSFYADLLGHGGKDGKPLSAQSVQHVHALLRHILNHGVRWGWLTSNPALKASPPKVRKKEILTPDPDEVMLLIAEAERIDPDLAVFLRLAAVTGARRGELCALRWTDIDLAAGSVTIARAIVGQRNDELIEKDTKTHAGRRIALDLQTVDVLARHRDRCEARAAKAETTLPDDAFLFSPSIDGSRAWRPGGVSLAFTRLRKRAGVSKIPSMACGTSLQRGCSPRGCRCGPLPAAWAMPTPRRRSTSTATGSKHPTRPLRRFSAICWATGTRLRPRRRPRLPALRREAQGPGPGADRREHRSDGGAASARGWFGSALSRIIGATSWSDGRLDVEASE